jgi:ubiquinone/menaquinone biosynthesis C-methylase UbiE
MDTENKEDTAGYIDPKKLRQHYSIEQHTRLADEYFSGRQNHWYLYQKPFFHPNDCAAMLSNLGDLFAGLELQPGMKVLDFAAGSGWLTRYLLQLGCRVVCSDASEQALAIASNLIRKFPPITGRFDQPVYLQFKGETIELEDNSVDRIVVFDAFHHLPNTRKILAEFFRVLKPGGIVGMSEPGRFHSRTEASQMEMKNFQVLENDVVLEEVWQEAQEQGFSDISVTAVIRNRRMPIADYESCIKGSVPQHLVQSIHENTVNQSIFFLHKPNTGQPGDKAQDAAAATDRFDEAWYLATYPDVADAIRKGYFGSGREHFEAYGRTEGRHAFPRK